MRPLEGLLRAIDSLEQGEALAEQVRDAGFDARVEVEDWTDGRPTAELRSAAVTTAAVPLRASPRERVLAQPAIDALFLATILFVTFAKIHWELAADLSLADVLTAGFLLASSGIGSSAVTAG